MDFGELYPWIKKQEHDRKNSTKESTIFEGAF